jgi:N6-adenosine-specific RNA methylase IME4
MVDPPWPKKKGGRRAVRPDQGRALDYRTLNWSDIWDVMDGILPVPSNQTPHCVFLWCVDEFLHLAELAMGSVYGYRRHARLIWDKTNGVAPAYTVRFAHEYLLWYYRPKLPPVAREARGKFTTVIRAPGRQHSRKPDEAYAMVEALYPDAARLDVFSREPRPGWEQFGDQCGHFAAEAAP